MQSESVCCNESILEQVGVAPQEIATDSRVTDALAREGHSVVRRLQVFIGCRVGKHAVEPVEHFGDHLAKLFRRVGKGDGVGHVKRFVTGRIADWRCEKITKGQRSLRSDAAIELWDVNIAAIERTTA